MIFHERKLRHPVNFKPNRNCLTSGILPFSWYHFDGNWICDIQHWLSPILCDTAFFENCQWNKVFECCRDSEPSPFVEKHTVKMWRTAIASTKICISDSAMMCFLFVNFTYWTMAIVCAYTDWNEKECPEKESGVICNMHCWKLFILKRTNECEWNSFIPFMPFNVNW